MIILEEDLKSVIAQWASERDNSSSLVALTKSKLTIDATLSQLLEAATEICESKESGIVDDLFSAELAREQEAAYKAKHNAVVSKIEELYDVASDEGAFKERDLKVIEKNASDDYPAAIESLEELLGKTEQRLQFAIKMRAGFLKGIDEIYLAAKSEATAARQKLISGKTKGFDAYFENLLTEMDELKASFTEDSNVSSTSGGRRAFEEILTTMRTVISDAKSGTGPSFDKVLKDLQDLVEKLGESAVGECKPAAKKGLEEEVKSLQGVIKTQTPTQGEKSVADFGLKVDALVQAAKNSKLFRDNIIKPNLKTAADKIKQVEKQLPNLEYTETLKVTLDGIKATAKVEDKEEEANRKIATLLIEISRALDDPEFLELKDVEARNNRQTQLEQEQEFKTKRKIFKSTMSDVRKAMDSADEADETMWDELKAMQKQADDFAKNKTFEQAIDKLASATQRAEKVKQNPQGEKVTSRNNLPKDLDRYHKAVSAYVRSIESIAEEIRSTDTEMNEAAQNTACNLLNKMAFEFEKAMFDRNIAVLSAKDSNVDSKRAAREESLRSIRLYQERLDKGPLMVKVLLAPFEASQYPAFDALRLSLNSMDVNIRRCV